MAGLYIVNDNKTFPLHLFHRAKNTLYTDLSDLRLDSLPDFLTVMDYPDLGGRALFGHREKTWVGEECCWDYFSIYGNSNSKLRIYVDGNRVQQAVANL